MLLPQSLIDLIKRFEGCRLTAYQDVAGVWTIGYGHTGLDVRPGLVWTQEQAEAALLVDAGKHYSALMQISPSLLQESEGRRAALTDFVYNLGAHSYQNSTLRKTADAKDWTGVKAQLRLWIHAGGKVQAGLVKRREAECSLIDA